MLDETLLRRVVCSQMIMQAEYTLIMIPRFSAMHLAEGETHAGLFDSIRCCMHGRCMRVRLHMQELTKLPHSLATR